MNTIQALCEPHQKNVQQLELAWQRDVAAREAALGLAGGLAGDDVTATGNGAAADLAASEQGGIYREITAAHVVRIAPVYRALQQRVPAANFGLRMNRNTSLVLFLRRWRAEVHFKISDDGSKLQVSNVIPSGVDGARPEFTTIDEATAYVDQLMML